MRGGCDPLIEGGPRVRRPSDCEERIGIEREDEKRSGGQCTKQTGPLPRRAHHADQANTKYSIVRELTVFGQQRSTTLSPLLQPVKTQDGADGHGGASPSAHEERQ